MRNSLLGLVLLGYAFLTIPFLNNLLLSYDEAHYALYGYYLDWIYFDHPPLVGWIQAAMQLLGDSELFLRLPAFICSSSVLVGVWFFLKDSNFIANEISPKLNSQLLLRHKQIFCIALVLFLSIPMFMLLSFALVPDTLLMALTLPIIIQTQRTSVKDSWLNYSILGFLIGIACLTKYTAIFLAISSASYILWARGWKELSNIRCYYAVLLALLIFSPVIIWNIESSGSSFAYQLDHGFGREWLNLTNVLLSQLLQVFAYGPLVYVINIAAMLWIITTKRKELYILIFFALPIFLLFFVSPAFGKFLPHWVAAMIVTLLPASAIMLYEMIISQSNNNQLSLAVVKKFCNQRKLLSSSLALLLFVSLITLLPLRFVVSGLEIKFPPHTNPQKELIGWDNTSKLIKQDNANSDASDEQFIFVNNWSYASPLAWYARPMKVIVIDDRLDQFDIWFGSPQQGQSGYLIVSSHDPKSVEKIKSFTSCDLWNDTTYNIKGSPALTLMVYKCTNLIIN